MRRAYSAVLTQPCLLSRAYSTVWSTFTCLTRGTEAVQLSGGSIQFDPLTGLSALVDRLDHLDAASSFVAVDLRGAVFND